MYGIPPELFAALPEAGIGGVLLTVLFFRERAAGADREFYKLQRAELLAELAVARLSNETLEARLDEERDRRRHAEDALPRPARHRLQEEIES